MSIRIQPREICIPPDNPFENDRLNRQEPAEILTHLLGSLEGPCVLAIDAMWGNGKTTFLRMWTQHLRNQEFPVVEFNAWETDFSGDPFVALSTELTEGLSQDTDTPLEQKIAETKERALKVMRRAVPGLIRVATAGILDVGSLVEKEAGQFLASYAEARMSEYQGAQQSVEAFQDALQNMAKTLSESHQGRPLVVMIDELDRCRPSYAVELLETAKHLFAVDHIIFVLAVNRPELAHSVRALYGSGFDAEGYLGRFFDMDFVLPAPERNAFIDDRLTAIQLDKYLGRTKDKYAREEFRDARNLLLSFFGASDLSLRRIAQSIHRLGLVLASLQSNQWAFASTAVVALILRTINAGLYHRFVHDEISDLDVVDPVFARPEVKALRETAEGRWFEATIIVIAQERDSSSLTESAPITPLLDRYQRHAKSPSQDDPDRQHAEEVIRIVKLLKKNSYAIQRKGFGFQESVRRLEMLSASLKDEAPQ